MKSYLLLLASFSIFSLNAQVHYRTLDHNNASALISDAGTFFQDFDNGISAYEIPKGSGKKAIYSTNFFCGGITSTGDTNFILGGYPGLGTDLFNGPYSSTGSYNDSSYQSTWESSIWMFSQEEINNFIITWEACAGPNANANDCANAPTLSNETLSKLDSWPAHGDIMGGQSYWMAPFYDNPDGPSGSDAIYSPLDGDYPLLKGCKSVYLIQNDDGGIKTFSGTASLGLEVHYMFYQYKTWDFLDDVTFVDVSVVNRSNNDYPNFVYGLNADVDLGFYGDDYIGCDSSRNMMYFYNGDSYDEDNGGQLGYGNNPPALGFVALQNNITSSSPYYSFGLDWNLMDGKQANGQNWIHPEGYATNFVYSGNPNTLTEWSENSLSNPPQDRRGLMSIMHGALNSGDTIRETYAIIFADDGNNLENVQTIIDLSEQVKTFYENESDIACQNGIWSLNELSKADLLVYPNPTQGKINVNSPGSEIGYVEILDLTGKIIYSVSYEENSSLEIDLSNCEDGTYLLKTINKSGIALQRIVVQD